MFLITKNFRESGKFLTKNCQEYFQLIKLKSASPDSWQNQIKWETLFTKQNNLRVYNFGCDVKIYMKIIYTVQIVINCNTCGSQMVYHACYTVQYKSNTIQTEIVILRYKCKQCNVTHALKPEFLASRHQYDTFER